jgi:tetratricopeptide (TPR) repeat protein
MSDAQHFFELGNAKLEEGNYDLAIENFSQAILLDENNLKAFYNRGIALKDLKNYSGALFDFNKVISLNPQDAQVFYQRAMVYYELGKSESAYQDWGRACEIDYLKRKEIKETSEAKQHLFLKKKIKTYLESGNSFFQEQAYQKAIDDYTQVIQINGFSSAHISAFYNRGRAKAKLQDYEGALADYDSAILLDAQFAKAYFEKALIFSVLEQDELALESYTQAIACNSAYISAYFFRGRLSAKKELLKEALEDFNITLALNPSYAPALFERGIVYYKMQDTRNACVDWQKAFKLGYEPAQEFLTTYCMKTSF